MDDAGPQSLFLVVSWNTQGPYSSSIIQLETPPQVDNHEYASSSANTPVFPTEFSAHFPHLSQAGRPIWLEMATSTEDLYMLPDWSFNPSLEEEEDVTLPGFIFNLSTKKCKIIKPPLAPKYMGHAVMLGDHLYFMAQPDYRGTNSPDPRFERYDTLSQKWEELEPLPLYTTYGNRLTGFIVGTAVLDDTILFYIHSTSSPKTLQAYNVGRNKWYPVEVLNDLCYSLVGVSVVLNKIIYGLPLFCESVVALTLTSQEKDGDLVFTCDLHKEYKVPDMREKKYERWWDSDHWTQHLVHLGKDNFCFVQSSNCGALENQYIQLTNIEVSEKNSIVTNIFIHEFKIPRTGVFSIRHCFSVPKCKTTTALKQGKGFLKFNPEHEAEIVTLPPELLQFQDRYSSQTNIIDEQGGSVSQSSQSRDDADTKTPQVQEDVPKKSSASVVTGNQSLNDATKASTLGDGHSICVTNLPRDANCGQFFRSLMKFGPFKNFDFRFDHNNPSESCVDVEFESATSKQNAIKASPIKIGDFLAVIEEKRGTGLTQGGSVSQTSQSRDDADTTPRVQEDVPKKSSATVVAGKSKVPSSASPVTGNQSLNYARKASTLGDGRSIFLTNLPLDANCRQLIKSFKRFGLIKSVGIKTYSNYLSECCFGDVEFESATSKLNAIKASIIEFGDRLAMIEEKRGTGLTQGDSNRSSSKTSRNKLKKHGKDSRSKTSRKGLSRITPL